MDKQAFVARVNQHDLTHMYSDDAEVRRRGHDDLMGIRADSMYLDEDFVKATWNAKVDRTVGEAFRKDFYWKGTYSYAL